MTETISQEFIDFYTFGGLHGVRIIMDIKNFQLSMCSFLCLKSVLLFLILTETLNECQWKKTNENMTYISFIQT